METTILLVIMTIGYTIADYLCFKKKTNKPFFWTTMLGMTVAFVSVSLDENSISYLMLLLLINRVLVYVIQRLIREILVLARRR